MARSSKWATARFVAWDGEGVTVKGRHRYLMLRNSDGRGITDRAGLGTAQCLDALVTGMLAAGGAWHVGFAFSYDVNMMLGDLSRRQLFRVHRGRWVQWGDFRFRYRRAKSFTVQRYQLHGKGGRGWHGGTVWDTFGFFQSSFVAACESYGVGNPEVREAVAAMKQARSQFKATDLDAIESYCEDECRLLVELMTKLKGYLDEAGLRLARWDGAGAVAASLLTREGVKSMKGLPSNQVQDAIQYAFAGGRIELVQYGHFQGEVHHYDINSAYPTALRAVPCLSHGQWRAVGAVPRRVFESADRSVFGLYRVRWSFGAGAPIYPFFWRAPDGRVFYPRSGEGWYWWPEVVAAMRALRVDVRRHHRLEELRRVSEPAGEPARVDGRPADTRRAAASVSDAGRSRSALSSMRLARESDRHASEVERAGVLRDSQLRHRDDRARLRGTITILEGFEWVSACDHGPFGFIPPLFEQRRQWKRDGRGAEKVLKLGLNSLYGKCAQHVGGTETEPPPWHQLEWAGWTTSVTRAALFEAAMQSPESIVFMATDGIYSTAPLDVPLGKALGEWDYQRHRGITAVQSGVYWVDDDESTKAFHRGFDPASIDRAAVLAAWARGETSVTARSTRFIAMGQALAGGKQWGRWRQWADAPRELQLTPLGTKRCSKNGGNPAVELVPTDPYDPMLEALPLLSTPAALPWRELIGVPVNDDEVEDEAEDAIL